MPTTTGFWVKVENGSATQVWDSAPPAGEAGWVEAVEIKPDLAANREFLDGFTIDVTKTPVEIIYTKISRSWQERKESLKTKTVLDFKAVEERQKILAEINDPLEPFDPQVLENARQTLNERLASISAAESHDALDALNLD